MEQGDLLRLLVAALEDSGTPYAIGGSVASIAFGEPRSTLDIDVVTALDAERLEQLQRHFPAPEFHFDLVAAKAAVQRGEPFNIIHPTSGMKIDVFSDRDEVARSQIERGRRLAALPGLTAVFSAPEELIVKKLQYFAMGGSDKHLRDIRAMLEISADEIDLDRLGMWVERLGLEDEWSRVQER